MAAEKNNKTLNVPNLRFPEFSGEWELVALKEVADFANGKAHEDSVSEDGKYILINSKFISTEGKVKKYTDKQLSPLYKNQIVMVMSDLPNGKALAKCYYINEDDKYTLNQRICSLTPTCCDSRFLLYQINRNKYYLRFDDGVNQTNLKKGEVLNCPVYLPSSNEQQKISALLSLLDQRIATQKKVIEDLKKLKDAIRTKLFKQVENRCDVYNEIRNMLNYEQPTEYLVSSTEYSDNYKTPVLTANKAFILGYTDEVNGIYDKGNCIILDDFTMDVKYVTFPFKVKSSAIKILTSKQDVDLYFMYEYLLYLGLVSEEHKRHYISEIEPMSIICPPLPKQRQISNVLRALEIQVESAETYQDLLSKQKQYLLNQMFI